MLQNPTDSCFTEETGNRIRQYIHIVHSIIFGVNFQSPEFQQSRESDPTPFEDEKSLT